MDLGPVDDPSLTLVFDNETLEKRLGSELAAARDMLEAGRLYQKEMESL